MRSASVKAPMNSTRGSGRPSARQRSSTVGGDGPAKASAIPSRAAASSTASAGALGRMDASVAPEVADGDALALEADGRDG